MRISRQFKPEIVASTDDSRGSICQPQLVGNNVVATNGRILAVIPVEREITDTDGPIPSKAFRMARANGGDGRMVTMPLHKASVSFKRDGEITVLKRQDKGRFPDYQNVIPPVSRKEIHFAMDYRLLAELGDALGTRGPVILSLGLNQNGLLASHDPIVVRSIESGIGRGNDAMGVLMPMRFDGERVKIEVKVGSDAGEEAIRILREALINSGCDGDLCTHTWHESARKLMSSIDSRQPAQAAA